ncbi:MAG: hypothetical protein MIO93_13925 [ANME-2 cluster archaeon]|nr:hypothetical protein [ANME-2 cluster archaeon]
MKRIINLFLSVIVTYEHSSGTSQEQLETLYNVKHEKMIEEIILQENNE